MQLNKFLEKFLPDYGVLLIKEDVNLMDEHRMFNERHFVEALQNFADIICEKQRKECMNTYVLGADDIDNFLCIEIQNCKQPEIDKL
jgi:hypothetical protein